MADTIARHPLTEGVKYLVNTAFTARGILARVDVGRAPQGLRKDPQTGELVDGYGIVYPLTSPALWGPLAAPERALTATYQVTWVGRNYEHCGRLSDAGHAAICGRGPGGWLHDLDPVGVAVLDRRCRERGGPEQQSGGIWQAADIYDMEVQAGA